MPSQFNHPQPKLAKFDNERSCVDGPFTVKQIPQLVEDLRRFYNNQIDSQFPAGRI